MRTIKPISIPFFIILIILLAGCYHKNIKTLPLLVVNEKELFFVLDTVINFEKRCDYYQDSIYFSIDIYPPDKVLIESGRNQNTPLSLNPLGYFRYKNHLFFVFIKSELNKNWFTITNKKKKFSFKEVRELPYIDDSWTTTQFYYNNNKFTLSGRWSMCGEDIEPEEDFPPRSPEIEIVE